MEQRFKCAICVDLIVYRNNGKNKEILLMKRKNTGFDDGNFELPGGHLERNEDLFDAMIREASEELKISPKRNDLKLVHLMHHYTGERLNFIFELNGENFVTQIGEPDKCDKLEWFNINKLPNNISGKMRQIIVNVVSDKFYDKM
jgi:8-oxo-dGTP pyrophosphatase MutT (NUDIX family)